MQDAQRRASDEGESEHGARTLQAGQNGGLEVLAHPVSRFVSSSRQPLPGLPVGFAEFAPDLAVEVLSPEDREREILDKVGEYLGAGVRARKRTAAVFRSLTDVRRIEHDGALDGEDVVPGFNCQLAEPLA